ncbi:MAG: T9SS type A sorting domain-containing protein [Flavobacteriales bacterium]|jgi:hypothetical protein|nr:T9SS type A sorting domain-containing protein [Flavobacteriales bacterium]
MKKITTFLSVAFIGVSMNAQIEPTDTDGNGFRNVSTLEHLRWISENGSSWSSSFELDNDINASATSSWSYYNDVLGFKPIGSGFLSNFDGVFDGRGYSISGLYVNSQVPGTQVGLFSTTNNATIQNLNLENCHVESDNFSAGLLVGRAQNTTINNCSVNGTVNGGEKVGGLVGSAIATTINNCLATVNIPSVNNYVGGLVGELKSGSLVSNSNSSGVVAGNDDVGGLVGYSGNSAIENSYTSVNVSSDKQDVGGFIGYNYQTSISESYSTGLVTLTGQSSTKSGGFVGYNNLGTITLCYSLGTVSSEDTEVGGFVGYNEGTIAKSYVFANVIGKATVGGFVGENVGTGIIQNCYSRGAVTATGAGHVYLGGFAGSNNFQGELVNCYATGYVSAPHTSFTDIGGFVGDNNTSAPQSYRGVVTDCYWDNMTSGMSVSDGATGESTSNMKQQSTYTNWDFNSVWTINESFNNGYPYLNLYTVGIKQNELAAFNVYPNPVKDRLVVDAETDVYKISIVDLRGSVVLQNIDVNVSYIDVSNLIPGVYLVQINDQQLTKKIIKQ